MSASPYLVDTSPLAVPPGCGCCSAAEPLCCFCADTLCADFTNPDWASWGCSGGLFTSPGEIKLSVGLTTNTLPCGTGGSTQAYYQYGTAGAANSFQLFPQCGPFVGYMQMAATLELECVSGTGTFRIRYSGVLAFLIADSTGSPCIVIPTTTMSLPATVIVSGTPPVSLGSLSPTSLTFSDGPCGMSAMAAPMFAATAEPPPPCVYLSEDPLPAGEVARLGFSVIRQWRECDLGQGLPAPDGNTYVCGCAPWPNGGCAGCPGYQPRPSQS